MYATIFSKAIVASWFLCIVADMNKIGISCILYFSI